MVSRPSSLDPLSTTLAVQLAGPQVVTEGDSIKPDAKRVLSLTADRADLTDSKAIMQFKAYQSDIGSWGRTSDIVKWMVEPPAPGTYHVALNTSCNRGEEGSSIVVLVDGVPSDGTATIAATKSVRDFVTAPIAGTLSLSSGKHVIGIKETSVKRGGINVHAMTLTP